MGQGRGNAKALLCVVALFAVLQAVAATDIVVGGSSQKWDYPPGTNAGYYDTWAAGESFAPGDNLVFEYMAGAHDVQLVSRSEYTGCSISTGKTYASGNDVVPLPTAGDYYFICTFPGHCESGMKVTVTVKAATATPPPATPPATPPPVATPPATPPPVATPPPTPPPVVAPAPATPPPVKAPAPAPVKVAPAPAPVKPAPVPAPAPVPVVAPTPVPVLAPAPVPESSPVPAPVPEASSPVAPTPPVAQAPTVAPAPPPGSSGHSLRACLTVVGGAAMVGMGALLF